MIRYGNDQHNNDQRRIMIGEYEQELGLTPNVPL
jgi:hypothetical protein